MEPVFGVKGALDADYGVLQHLLTLCGIPGTKLDAQLIYQSLKRLENRTAVLFRKRLVKFSLAGIRLIPEASDAKGE